MYTVRIKGNLVLEELSEIIRGLGSLVSQGGWVRALSCWLSSMLYIMVFTGLAAWFEEFGV